jgi:hypothetical protein
MQENLKNIVVPEDTIHQHCIQWFNMQYGNSGAILHHSPNENPRGVQSTLIRYNAKMKALGRKAGFPDIIILHQGRVLFVELKSQTGTLSAVQKSLFQEFQRAGFEVKVVRSLEEFIEVVDQFICF